MTDSQSRIVLVTESVYVAGSSVEESIEGLDVSGYQTLGAVAYSRQDDEWFRYDPTSVAAPILFEVIVPLDGLGRWLLVDPLAIFFALSDAVHEWTGWPNQWPTPPPVTMTVNDGTRTLTLTPTGASFDIYESSRRVRKTGVQSVTWPDAEGMHFFLFDDTGTLIHTTSTSVWEQAILGHGVLVSTVYWDATNKRHIRWAEERHGFMPGPTHFEFHNSFGARFEAPAPILSDFDIDGTGNVATNAEWSASAAVIFDEDVRLHFSDGVPQSIALPAQLPVFYFSGPNPNIRRKDADNYPMIYSGSGGYVGANGRIAYNQFTAGAWQLTEAGETEYVWVHVFVTTDIEEPYTVFTGLASYANIPAAEAGVQGEMANIRALVQEQISHEFVPVGSVLVETSTGYGNVPKARTVSTTSGNYVDWTTAQLVGSPSLTLVASVFGRTGAILAVAGDYAASQVTNDSGVAGAFVSLALDWLNANKVPITRNVNTTAPLAGGGPLNADLTLTVATVSGASSGVVPSVGAINTVLVSTGGASTWAFIGDASISDVAWGKVTATPTTLAGYGITDAVPNTRNVNTTAPLAGGGPLNADLTLSVATVSNLTAGVVPAVGAAGTLLQSTGPASNWVTVASLNLVPQGRTLSGTAPIRIDGGASADLSANRTVSITPASGAAAGSMSAADFTKLAGIRALATSAPLLWGNGDVSASTTTRFMTPGYSTAVAPTTTVQFRIPFAGTLKNLRIRCRVAGGNGNPIVYTLQVNGVNSALTVSLNSNVQDGSDLAHSVVVAAGDLLGITVTKALAVGTSPVDIMASLELSA